MKPEEALKATYATLACTASDGSRVCFAASTSGLARSTDDGRTWHDAYASLDAQSAITTLAVAASPAFAVDRFLLSGTIDGVLSSRDAGTTWATLEFPAPAPAISSIVFSPNFSKDGFAFAGTLENGVYCSAGRGMMWAAWNFGLTDLNVLDLAVSPQFATDGTLFAATESGVFRSANGGRGWRDTAFPSEFSPVISIGVSPLYAIDHTLFAGTEEHGLLRSTDEGSHWDSLGEAHISGAVNTIEFCSAYAFNPQILALANGVVVLSLDGGDTWSTMTHDKPLHAGIASMAAMTPIAPDMELLLGLTDGSVVTSRAITDLSDD
ncbi:MAG: hypothetical protein M5U23_04795 [Acidimicrobiia bacterium]|nr:hypothetical protein [Acidimicrobiia bacterium]